MCGGGGLRGTGSSRKQVLQTLQGCLDDTDLEVQQRAGEVKTLLERFPAAAATALTMMPKFSGAGPDNALVKRPRFRRAAPSRAFRTLTPVSSDTGHASRLRQQRCLCPAY